MGKSAHQRRVEREKKTVAVMTRIFCRAHHNCGKTLCTQCDELLHYANTRVDHCPFGIEKPTCLNCTVHCYQKSRRESIRSIMRFAGPRMPWKHPVLTLFHFIDKRRPAPKKALHKPALPTHSDNG